MQTTWNNFEVLVDDKNSYLDITLKGSKTYRGILSPMNRNYSNNKQELLQYVKNIFDDIYESSYITDYCSLKIFVKIPIYVDGQLKITMDEITLKALY